MSPGKKLQKAFDQGYASGCEDTHANWIQSLQQTPGIGPKRRKQIMQTMERICREKVTK